MSAIPGASSSMDPPRHPIPEDVQSLVDQIHRYCGKIVPAAKKETSQLTDLCNDLIKHLHVLQNPNFNDIRGTLARIVEKLAVWSKYNYGKRLLRRTDIESGFTECIQQLTSIISQCTAIQPAQNSLPGDQGVDSSGGGSVEGTPQMEEAGEEVASVVAGIGHNAGTFILSTKNVDDDAGFANIQKVRFSEPSLRRTVEQNTDDDQSAEANEAPPVRRLDGEVVRTGEMPFSGGMHFEVWTGRWEKGGKKKSGGEVNGEKIDDKEASGEKVALKAFRALKSPERARKRLERELPSWAELRHPNILPFYGVVTDIGPRLWMVSPWQENGNLLVYVKNNPQPNKDYLLRGSAAGLSYLHSRNVVHGSVKCKNVFVSREGEPLICDFAIAKIVEEITEGTISKTLSNGDIVRYGATELVETNNVSPTMHSDTYSFALLILECITEERPFSNLIRDAAVIHARVSKRQYPPRPDGQYPKNRVSDGLWDLMMRCWAIQPEQRPTMEQVHSFFLHQARRHDI